MHFILFVENASSDDDFSMISEPETFEEKTDEGASTPMLVGNAETTTTLLKSKVSDLRMEIQKKRGRPAKKCK